MLPWRFRRTTPGNNDLFFWEAKRKHMLVFKRSKNIGLGIWYTVNKYHIQYNYRSGIIACIKCMWCVVSDFKDHNILSICTSVSENPQFCNSTCIVRWAFQLNCSPAYGLLRISSFHPVEKQTKLPKHIGQTHRMPMSVPGRVGYIRNHHIQHVENIRVVWNCVPLA